MKFIQYLRGRLSSILLQTAGIVLLSAFLRATGNSFGVISIVALCWVLISAVVLLISFFVRRSYLNRLLDTAYALDRRYLLPDVMERPLRPDDQVFYELLRMSGKSMLEQVSEISRERREYREYIEDWIHEVKTPIAAVKLICDNRSGQIPTQIIVELEKIDRCVEQALYYARSEAVEKDFLVREICLSDLIHRVVSENKQFLLRSQMNIRIEDCSQAVYTDSKWLAYILKQLIVNAVQYKVPTNAELVFSSQSVPQGVLLQIKDNGIGIPSEDLSRVFEKGFTGKNGRRKNGATGMGLYLCKRLCEKMGLSLQVEVPSNGFTTFTISFPTDIPAGLRN